MAFFFFFFFSLLSFAWTDPSLHPATTKENKKKLHTQKRGNWKTFHFNLKINKSISLSSNRSNMCHGVSIAYNSSLRSFNKNWQLLALIAVFKSVRNTIWGRESSYFEEWENKMCEANWQKQRCGYFAYTKCPNIYECIIRVPARTCTTWDTWSRTDR